MFRGNLLADFEQKEVECKVSCFGKNYDGGEELKVRNIRAH